MPARNAEAAEDDAAGRPSRSTAMRGRASGRLGHARRSRPSRLRWSATSTASTHDDQQRRRSRRCGRRRRRPEAGRGPMAGLRPPNMKRCGYTTFCRGAEPQRGQRQVDARTAGWPARPRGRPAGTQRGRRAASAGPQGTPQLVGQVRERRRPEGGEGGVAQGDLPRQARPAAPATRRRRRRSAPLHPHRQLRPDDAGDDQQAADDRPRHRPGGPAVRATVFRERRLRTPAAPSGSLARGVARSTTMSTRNGTARRQAGEGPDMP